MRILPNLALLCTFILWHAPSRNIRSTREGHLLLDTHVLLAYKPLCSQPEHLAMTGMWRLVIYTVLLAIPGGFGATQISPKDSLVKSERKFTIENDRFVKDGKPLQIISGRWAP